jgi:uncharacterized protein YydD (DUF2326 family)
MKLVKIYANKNFKNIEFNAGFNVVLATIFDKDKKKDTHNLGKTSLIHVINFILLGSLDKKIFGNKIFNGVVFYGELALNNGTHLIVKREIDSNTKISFKIFSSKTKGFTFPESWDEENIAFEKARKKLNEYLGFNILCRHDYRKSITYFLRTQQDYLDVYKLDKFRGKHIQWKPFVFELLGYDGDLLIKKLTLEEDITNKKAIIKVLKNEAKINIKDRDKLAGLLDIKEQEVNEVKNYIDKFNFYELDKQKNHEIIEYLDNTIQIYSTERYRVSYEINKIEESLANINEQINIKDLEQLHKEAQLIFPEELKKEFSELVKFNESISRDRKRYLLENLHGLKNELEEINLKLKQLELKKSDELTFLTETNSYAKFKEYQKDLSKVEADIERIKDKISAIDESLIISNEIAKIDQEVKESIKNISIAINQRKHAEINRIFNSIISEVLNTNALISIIQNNQGNIEYSADYQNPVDLNATSESQGTTYKKLLCMAFDLSLLIYYSNKSFFRFVYHDGILEGLDYRIKIRLLNKVKEICRDYNLQYVLSLIDTDIPADLSGKKYEFSDSEICLELNDKDDSGKLFLHSF